MKILLASSGSGSRGGGELFLVHLSRSLLQLGHEVILWIPANPRMDELAAKFEPAIRILRSPYPNTYFDRKFRSLFSSRDRKTIARIADEWKKTAPDVIHVNQQTPEDALDLLQAAERTGIPAVSTVHITQSAASLRARFGRLRDLAARATLRRTRCFLAAVSDLRGRELRNIAGDKVTVIYNGVEETPPPEHVADRPLRMLGIGRIEPQKNPLRFLEIAARLAKEAPALRFTWVGDGGMRAEFESHAASLGLTDRLDMPGWVNDVRPFLAESSFYVHPAEFEGLPFSIIEALRAGLPSLVSPGVIAEAAPLSSACLELDRVDWSRVLADPVWREELGHKSRAVWEAHFRAEVMARAYVRLYQSAAS